LAADAAATPMAAVLPLDASLPNRLEALAGLWRQLQGGMPRPDPLTRQRRLRLKAMLRTLDGRRGGAAYRDIAIALYGNTRVSAAPWKSSSLRDATMRLARDGAALVEGGYRDLLI